MGAYGLLQPSIACSVKGCFSFFYIVFSTDSLQCQHAACCFFDDIILLAAVGNKFLSHFQEKILK